MTEGETFKNLLASRTIFLKVIGIHTAVIFLDSQMVFRIHPMVDSDEAEEVFI